MRYGWVVVATSAFGLMFGAFPIVVASFAVFFKSYLQEFHAGRGAVSLALTIHNVFAAFLAASIGRFTDRFGARKVILSGLVTLSLVLLSAEVIGGKVWQLYVFYGCLGLVSSTTTSVPYGVIVSRWFNRDRGVALGLTMAGLGVGGMVWPPLVQTLIARFGWRSALAIAGGATLLIATPVIGLFLQEAPRTPDGEAPTPSGQTAGLTWREIQNSRTFWVMIAAFVLAAVSISACTAHIAALFSDRGASPASAAFAASAMGLALLLGRAGTGFFLDRYFGPRVAASVFAASALGVAVLWTGVVGVPALAGAFLVGLGYGAEGDIIAYLMSRYFGLRSLGAAFGFAFGAFILASGVGPLLMGLAFDRTGAYTAPLAVFFIACLAAAALMSRLGPYRLSRAPTAQPRAGSQAVEV